MEKLPIIKVRGKYRQTSKYRWNKTKEKIDLIKKLYDTDDLEEKKKLRRMLNRL